MSREVILVIHSVPEVVTTVSEPLHEAGYKVLTAKSREEVEERLDDFRFFKPDAVLAPLTVASDEAMLGSLFGIDPSAARLPVVVLANGDPEERRRALRMGWTTVVSSPYDGEDVVLNTRLALDRKRDDRMLSGSLAQMSPAELLQTAEASRRSGRLLLRHRNRSGTLWLHNGQVIDAEVDDGRRGEPAVYAMATWEEGTFEADFGPVSAPRRIEASTTSLLLEAMRRADEAKRDLASAQQPVQGTPEPRPNAALVDPPPSPPRLLWTVHRGLTLLNIAASHARDHLAAAVVQEKLEESRQAAAKEHELLSRFAVTEAPQVVFQGDASTVQGLEADALVAALAEWLQRLYVRFEHVLPLTFRLYDLAALGEAVYEDLEVLGFAEALGFESSQRESTGEPTHA